MLHEACMLATWCVRKLRGDARPSPYRVLSVAPGRRVWRARRRRMVMKEAASAPVVSATSSETMNAGHVADTARLGTPPPVGRPSPTRNPRV